MSRMEALELRRLFASLLPDVAWGDDGSLVNDPQPQLVGTASDGFVTYELSMTGNASNYTYNKFSSDGSSDSSFSVYLPNVSNAWATVDAQDRLIVATQSVNSSHELVVHRFTAVGEVDPSFGSDGAITIAYTAASNAVSYSGFVSEITTDSDGAVYIASMVTSEVDSDAFSGMYFDFTVTKLTSGGQVDATFANAGTLSPAFMDHSNSDSAWMLVDSQKRVLLGVSAQTYDVNRTARYTSAGALDTTFGNDGLVDVAPGFENFARQLDDQDRLVIVGRISAIDEDHDILTRVTENGQLDTTFGQDGWANILGGTPTALYLQPDGKIVVADIRTSGTAAIAFERFTSDGQPDTSFDSDGLTDFSEGSLVNQIFAYNDGGYLIASTNGIQRLTFATGIALGTSGTLYVRGTDSADSVTITKSGSQVTVTQNATSQNFAFAEITGINANLQGGANSFNSALAIPMTINTGDGNDTITTGSMEDSITSGDGNDSINSADGKDTIDGGGGSNTINAGAGGGDISAGAGDVAANSIVGTGNYTVSIHSDGLQTISLEGATASIFCYSDAGSRITLNMSLSARVTTGIGNDTIVTTDGNDTIFPGFGDDNVTTGAGDDLVAGEDYQSGSDFSYDDSYDMGAGNDIVRDAYGNNTVLGGDGNDDLRTGFGNDSIDGGQGKDTIRSGDGNDFLYGSGGRDKLFAGDGNDTVWGGGNNDTLVGGDGADILQGNRGNDLIVAIDSATTDHDTIDGGVGIDSLFGDADEDGIGIESILESLG